MRYTIENAFLRVEVESFGAEMKKIVGKDGTHYLWEGDAKYWKDSAPILFPYVARLWGGKYSWEGTEHEMTIHGFAKRSEFSLACLEGDAITLELLPNELSRSIYPAEFRLLVRYALIDNRVQITYACENTDSKEIIFGLGGHPGFNVPLEEGLAFEDYYLYFPHATKPVRVGFTDACYRTGVDEDYPLVQGKIALEHPKFDHDAIVLTGSGHRVVLASDKGKRRVTVDYPGMEHVGFWHRVCSDAPFVCVEPWVSLPGEDGKTMVFEQQPNLVHLQPGERYTNDWTITLE